MAKKVFTSALEAIDHANLPGLSALDAIDQAMNAESDDSSEVKVAAIEALPTPGLEVEDANEDEVAITSVAGESDTAPPQKDPIISSVEETPISKKQPTYREDGEPEREWVLSVLSELLQLVTSPHIAKDFASTPDEGAAAEIFLVCEREVLSKRGEESVSGSKAIHRGMTVYKDDSEISLISQQLQRVTKKKSKSAGLPTAIPLAPIPAPVVEPVMPISPPKRPKITQPDSMSPEYLAAELRRIFSNLKDKQVDWKVRVGEMEKLSGLLADGAASVSGFVSLFRNVVQSIIDQLGDTRTQIVTAACALISKFSDALIEPLSSHTSPIALGSGGGTAVEAMLCDFMFPAVFRLTTSNVKSIADGAIGTVVNILTHWETGRLTAIILHDLAHTTNTQRKNISMQFVLLILQKWNTATLAKHCESLGTLISQILTSDPKGPTRAVARKCFWSYCAHFPAEGSAMMRQMPAGLGKLLEVERYNSDVPPPIKAQPNHPKPIAKISKKIKNVAVAETRPEIQIAVSDALSPPVQRQTDPLSHSPPPFPPRRVPVAPSPPSHQFSYDEGPVDVPPPRDQTSYVAHLEDQLRTHQSLSRKLKDKISTLTQQLNSTKSERDKLQLEIKNISSDPVHVLHQKLRHQTKLREIAEENLTQILTDLKRGDFPTNSDNVISSSEKENRAFSSEEGRSSPESPGEFPTKTKSGKLRKKVAAAAAREAQGRGERGNRGGGGYRGSDSEYESEFETKKSQDSLIPSAEADAEVRKENIFLKGRVEDLESELKESKNRWKIRESEWFRIRGDLERKFAILSAENDELTHKLAIAVLEQQTPKIDRENPLSPGEARFREMEEAKAQLTFDGMEILKVQSSKLSSEILLAKDEIENLKNQLRTALKERGTMEAAGQRLRAELEWRDNAATKEIMLLRRTVEGTEGRLQKTLQALSLLNSKLQSSQREADQSKENTDNLLQKIDFLLAEEATRMRELQEMKEGVSRIQRGGGGGGEFLRAPADQIAPKKPYGPSPIPEGSEGGGSALPKIDAKHGATPTLPPSSLIPRARGRGSHQIRQ